MCRDLLPAHMIPDRVMVVGKIPVTPGGEKVDRNALAAIAAQLSR
jgi:non-ribosomal peptide synthetase component E (peptide arylation enzyme)